MRIAELHWAFPPTIGGVETHLSILGPALSERGHEVALLTGRPPGFPEKETLRGLRVYRTPWLDLNQMSRESFQQNADKIFAQVHGFLDACAPDVIHVHNWHYFSPIPLEAVLSWRSRHKAALILTAHNTWHDRAFRAMAQYQDCYDQVIAVSQYIADDLAAWGYDRDRIQVVRHGVTDEWLSRPRMPQYPYPQMGQNGRQVIFHPARMSLAKGSMVVVEAFEQVHRAYPDTFLLMAGTTQTVDWDSVQAQEIQSIQRRIAQCNLTESVGVSTFTWPDIIGSYDASTIAVYPSVAPEPFGIVVIEAMARQCPIVLSRSGGMPEIVEHGQSGLIVEPGDPDALANALHTLLRDPRRANRLRKNARRRVERLFRAEQMVDATENLMSDITGVSVEYDQPVAP